MNKTFLLLFLIPLLLIGCSPEEPEPITKAQWKSFSFLPYDSQFILYSNLKELRKTEHWKNFLESSFQANQAGNWLYEFEQVTGTGLSKGINEVIAATTWEGNNVIIIGFDSANNVKTYFENKGKFASAQLEGKTIYYPVNKDALLCYFADDSTLIMIKNEEYLSELINGKNKSLKENKKFISIINGIQNKDHYWMATDNGGFAATIISKLLGSQKDVPVNKIVSSIDNITLAAEFSDEVEIESNLGCKDEKSAYLLSAGIRSAIAMDMFSDVDYNLSKILEKLDVERQSNKLSLDITINKNDILQLQEISEKRKNDKKL